MEINSLCHYLGHSKKNHHASYHFSWELPWKLSWSFKHYRKLIILGKLKKHAHSHDHYCQERICGCTAWCPAWLLVSQCSFSGASKLFWNLKFSCHQGQSKGEVQHWGEDFLQPPILKHQYSLLLHLKTVHWNEKHVQWCYHHGHDAATQPGW